MTTAYLWRALNIEGAQLLGSIDPITLSKTDWKICQLLIRGPSGRMRERVRHLLISVSFLVGWGRFVSFSLCGFIACE